MTEAGSRFSGGPEERAAPGPFRPGWLSAQGRLPLAFMGLALVWLVAAIAMLVARPGLLALPHMHPHVVALTHAWVLGFFVTVACGAVYQLAPVALGTVLYRERHGWWHLGLHGVGVPGMVWAFWVWDMEWLGHFGTAVAVGFGLFCFNVWRTVLDSGPRRSNGIVAVSLVLSAGWLLATVIFGLLLSANRFWFFIPLDPMALLRAHAHIGLIGFFLTLIQGVAFQLLPMFTLGEVRDWRAPRAGLWLTQLGLVGLAPALAWRAAWPAFLCAVVVAVGLAFSVAGLWRALESRRKRALDPGIRFFLSGGVGLCVAAVCGLLLVLPGSPWGSAPGGFNAMTYGIIAFAGGLLPCIAGMMCKIVPFLTWMRVYGPLVGRRPTPSAGALICPRVETVAFALQALGIFPLLVGAWTLDEAWLRAGVWILGAGVILFVADMAGVLSHLVRTRPLMPGVATAP